jgi:hypothetical protein
MNHTLSQVDVYKKHRRPSPHLRVCEFVKSWQEPNDTRPERKWRGDALLPPTRHFHDTEGNGSAYVSVRTMATLSPASDRTRAGLAPNVFPRLFPRLFPPRSEEGVSQSVIPVWYR